MIASLVLLLMTLIITLDSIGSKRLRGRVIRRAQAFFSEAKVPEKRSSAEAPVLLQSYLDFTAAKNGAPLHTRMRYKAAVRRAGQKKWQPIEAKLFLISSPWRMVYYDDRTPGFLVSQKHFRQVDDAGVEQLQKIFSLFPQTAPPDLLARLYQVAMLPWLPGHAHWLEAEWQEADGLLSGTVHPGGVPVALRLELDTETGQLQSLHAEEATAGIALRVQYSDYEPAGSYRVPMRFIVEEEYAGKRYEYRCEVVDIVFNEAFAWW